MTMLEFFVFFLPIHVHGKIFFLLTTPNYGDEPFLWIFQIFPYNHLTIYLKKPIINNECTVFTLIFTLVTIGARKALRKTNQT